MTSTTDDPEYDYDRDYDDAFGDSSTKDPYYRVEEHLKDVHFKIVDYLAEVGRRDLFMDLTLSDLSSMIYDPMCIKELIRDHPDCLL